MESCLGCRLFKLISDKFDVEDALVDDIVASDLPEGALEGIARGAVALHVQPEA